MVTSCKKHLYSCILYVRSNRKKRMYKCIYSNSFTVTHASRVNKTPYEHISKSYLDEEVSLVEETVLSTCKATDKLVNKIAGYVIICG